MLTDANTFICHTKEYDFTFVPTKNLSKHYVNKSESICLEKGNLSI